VLKGDQLVHYMFETVWELTAPIEQVFEALSHPEDFHDWWPSVTRSELVSEGDANGIGAQATYTIRGPLLYSLTFDVKTIEVDRPRGIRAVVRGDLIGTGAYYLESTGSSTRVRFDWHVSTTKRWMNIAGAVIKPVLAWAHGHVMRQGGVALARHLNAGLISVSTKLVGAPTPVPVGQQL
jgi:carbon monoxide dehydrogenase subunit G